MPAKLELKFNPNRHVVTRRMQHEQKQRKSISLFLRILAICLAVAYVGELWAFHAAGNYGPDQSYTESPTFTFLIESRDDSRLEEMTWRQAIQYAATHPGEHVFKSSQ